MANTRTNIPQVNLKDRIAALQQRNTSPTPDVGNPSITSRIPMPGASSLRDKIGNFERKGAVPVPRTRFGSGAPPPGDTSPKKRGELYGNRVPELAKSTGEAALLIRNRTVSTSSTRSHSLHRPTSPPMPLQPQFTGDGFGSITPHLPSTLDRSERRSVSDILPHGSPALVLEEPLVSVESVAEENVTRVEEQAEEGQETIVSPAIFVVPEIDRVNPELSKETMDVSTDLASVSQQSVVLGSTAVEPAFEVLPDVTLAEVSAAPASTETGGLAEQERNSTDTIVAVPREIEVAEVTSSRAVQDQAAVVDATSTSLASTVVAEAVATDAIADAEPKESVGELRAVAAKARPSAIPEDQNLANSLPLATSKMASIVEDAPEVVPLPSASTQLSLNTEMDNLSGMGETSGSTESLQTPSDSMSFRTAESEDEKVEAQAAFVGDGLSGLVASNDRLDSSKVMGPIESTHSVFIPTSITSALPRGPASPAAVKVRGSQIKSPAVERPAALPQTPRTATLTPEPLATPSPTAPQSIPSRLPVSPSTPSIPQRNTSQTTFRAVVHSKVKETSPAAPAPAPPKRAVPSFPPPRAAPLPVQRVIAQASSEPESPSLFDLASLVADAALLEEQLATPGGKRQMPTPTFNVQPAIPEVRESQSFERPRLMENQRQGYGAPSTALETQSSASSGLFYSHLRASTTPDNQSPSRSSQGPRYFSSLRMRNKSMPGAYPRTSVCSEMSTDSSVLISNPPSPPSYGHEGSDASSVRSSTKSWKSSKKSISRASSWLFRSKSRSPSVAEEEPPAPQLPPARVPSPTLLSPHSPIAGQSGRPTSWVSISSTGSGEVFDKDLFDSFPSVPREIPRTTRTAHSSRLPVPSSSHTHNQQSANGTRAHTVAGRPTRR